jgi:phage replication-related protein YjqB (UPF0714/DUF867 family)
MREITVALAVIAFGGGATPYPPRGVDTQDTVVAEFRSRLGVSVRTARDEQPDLRQEGEHCSADADLLARIGRAKGHQVRIYKNPTSFGLYTVSELRSEDPDTIVRMGGVGRNRLGTEDVFAGVIAAQVPHPDLSERQAEERGEFVERLDDDGGHSGLIVIAPHGGAIEPHTDGQAELVATELKGKAVSSWRCKGWSQNQDNTAFQRWHITSADIHEASFPRLARVIDRHFVYAVSFHGFDRDQFPGLKADVLIGGRGEESLKEQLRGSIQGALKGTALVVRVARRGEPLNGDEPSNVVNRLAKSGGIQIEQSREAREHWDVIAKAVALVYKTKL